MSYTEEQKYSNIEKVVPKPQCPRYSNHIYSNKTLEHNTCNRQESNSHQE